MSIFGENSLRNRGGAQSSAKGQEAEGDASATQDASSLDTRSALPLFGDCEAHLQYSTAYKEKLQAKARSTRKDWIITGILTVLSAFTRLYRIGFSKYVVWDEAHFGKFGGYYIKHTFYHDVHPPLAKMLVALSEFLVGFDGEFTFESASEYPENVNYVFMRIFNAAFGIALVPFAYHTMRHLGCSRVTAAVAALFVCFDNAICTISRFILLDAMLLCFTAATGMCLAALHKHRNEPFSREWWKWLALCGVSIGLVVSSKWVGFLAMSMVGLYTLHDLYAKLGDRKVSSSVYLKHWVSRAVLLIAVPLAIYMLCFKIHFALLYKSGSGDSQMSSAFQARLEGSGLGDQPLDVAYGSVVTIRSAKSGVGLLHSHPHAYPEGSKQQQVTGYGHKDGNNDWVVHRAHSEGAGNYLAGPVELVKDGDIVRLVHQTTGCNLHSHNVKAPLTATSLEVSGYGNYTMYPDPNDHWKTELVSNNAKANPGAHLRAITTTFRLRHVSTGCYLRASGMHLPDWAWKQSEVVCDRGDPSKDVGTLWNIEGHVNGRLPKAKPSDFETGFLSDFWRLNVAMGVTNNALVPDPDKIDMLASAPTDWPLNRLGLRMCGWGDENVKYFLIGNPVTWWGSTLVAALFPLQALYYVIRSRRKLHDFDSQHSRDYYYYGGTILWLGWALHYLPFFLMGRVTYLHHYFPA
ncbi:Protein O-mannosyltransferase 2, partial [Spiromyces aspiralis]